MSVINVVIAEDHALVRQGLCQMLKNQSDIELVGEAEDGVKALEMAKTLRPDILLLDLSMPRMSGMEAVQLIKEAVPETKIVILSMHETATYAQQVLDAGASGYVPKWESSTKLLSAIRAVHKGECFLSPKLGSGVVESHTNGQE